MEIVGTVIKKVAELFKREDTSVSIFMRFDQDLSADSIDLAELMMWAEDEYDLDLDIENANVIKTVGDMVNFIESELEQKLILKNKRKN